MVDITDVGPSPDSFVGANAVRGGAGRILSLAAATDGRRLYAGGYSGVWRSDDAGQNWRQMTRPQPATFNADVPGALFAPYVVDLAVSPEDANLVIAPDDSSLIMAALGPSVAVSTNGGASWTLHRLDAANKPAWHVAIGRLDPNGA